jgi:predicted N-acetyltransferase YhbS
MATTADASTVVDFWRAAGTEPTHTDNVESVHRLLTQDPEALILAEEEGTLVGTVIAAWDGWRGSIHGLGLELVRLAEERLAGVGAVRCQAVVVANHGNAVGFWQQTGWEQQVERLRFVKG